MGRWLRGVRGAIGMGLTRRFDQMSLPRFAVWGAVGGLLFSVTFVLAAALGWDILLVLGPVFALSGAGCAAGSLALARRVEEPGSLDAGGDAAEVEPTGDEAKELVEGER